MKPFMTVDGEPMEAVEALDVIVNVFLSDQVRVGTKDDLVIIAMDRENQEGLWAFLKTVSAALADQDERDKATLLEIARKGLDRPDPSTRIGRQLNKFLGE